MMRCAVECIRHMGAEDLLCFAAIRLLKHIALFLSNEDTFLLLCSGDNTLLELWLLFTGGTSLEGRNYLELTNLLSPSVLTTLWEAVSSLTIRLISSAATNAVTPVGQSPAAAWVLDRYLSCFQEVHPSPLPSLLL
jgi:hypothetical protein